MMTRRRFGIRFKIWAAIMATVATIIAALWLMQVVFMEKYYREVKGDDIINDTKKIVKLLNDKDISTAVDEIYPIVASKTICVDISNEVGRSIVKLEGLGDNCFWHMNDSNKISIINDTIKNENTYVLTDIKHPKFDTHYNTCSILMETSFGDKIMVTVTATLAPVMEAANIIKSQLVYISIILALVATIIAFILARSITKPIRKITKAARDIASGKLDVDVSVKSRDEIGELSESFSYMTREIAKVSVLQKELVANISHDIRTPLTMIRGYAETIKDITGDDIDVRNHQLDIIVEETNRLNILVSEALDLSLMQSGQMALNLSDFDITKKIHEILARFELFEQADGFTFNLINEFNLPVMVNADQMRIEQVLYNLINNAINHIGVIKNITVSISEFEGEIKIDIADTGEGISQEDLPLIWDRYYKPYKKTVKKGKGTGLGLSIVKAILIGHNSRFGVYSTLGVGSTFWFTLARTPAENTDVAIEISKEL